MNLFCLIAINLAFRRGHLDRPAMLGWAGVALGFAGVIKFWAVAPALVLLVLCILTKTDRGRRVRSYILGLVVGFVVPAAPFLVTAPVTFIRSTIFDQAAREGTPVAFGVKMANLTGLIDFYSDTGKLMLNAGANSMFAAGEEAGIGDAHSIGWLPILAAIVLIALLVVGYVRQGRRLTPLELLSLATAVIATIAVTAYSAFFYHYADFPAPWIALSLGGAAGALAGHRRWSKIAMQVFAVLIVLVTVLQVREMYPLRRTGAQALASQIPPGACFVTDEVSLAIAADRFGTLPPGCPDIIDSLADTLVLSNGVSVQGGAQNMPAVVGQWQTWLGKADYVLLSPAHASRRRIPWTNGLSAWFNAEFVPDGAYSASTGQLYQRVNYTPPAGYSSAAG
jgi:hypothetical protein